MKLLVFGLSFALFIAVESLIFNPKCPDYCTELFNPVCAKSLRCTALFGNPCKLDAWNCKTARREEIFYRVDPSNCRHLNRYNNIVCRPI